MDKDQATNNLVISVNRYQSGEVSIFHLMEQTCQYFDQVKDEKITEADKEFLFFIANLVGIPQYYDTLRESFHQDTMLSYLGLDTLTQGMNEACLYTSSTSKIHRYQKEVLNKFVVGAENRFFLSATTSFGKTFLVYEVLRKMQYKNVVLVFPTIALLSENIERIYSQNDNQWIRDKYSIHTLTKIKEYGECNLFLYTPERYLSYTDNADCVNLDFVFVDEAYKLDNDYIINEENAENERDLAYRLCISHALQTGADLLLAGPFIKHSEGEGSFAEFLSDNRIQWLDYNQYHIVGKRRLEIKGGSEYCLDNHHFTLRGCNSKNKRIVEIIKTLLEDGENVIVYCSRKSSVESMAQLLLESVCMPVIKDKQLLVFTNHLKQLFSKSEDWVVTRAAERGVGVHHGLVPKYIQKELVELFNRKVLRVLFVTTTITEGVNTTAKNVIITSKMKGTKELKPFDALNIEGRAGRFLKHYVGNVIVVDSAYENDVHTKPIAPIMHKNYDLASNKTDVDLYYTDNKYLTEEDKERIMRLDELQMQYNIPDAIMLQYKVVSKRQKIKMFKLLMNWDETNIQRVQNVAHQFASHRTFNFNDFDMISSIVEEIVPSTSRLKYYLSKEHKQNRLFTSLLYRHFKNGLFESIGYYVNKGEPVDSTVRRQTEFVFNILRYDAVKYFGVFNLMYKYWLSQRLDLPVEVVKGIDNILQAMEYNAKTTSGMLAMDYGVPMKIVEYYDVQSSLQKRAIVGQMDDYEKGVLRKIQKIIKE